MLEGTSNIPETLYDSEFILQFKRGFEEASKFLPSGNGLVIDWESNAFLVKEQKEESKNTFCKAEKKDGNLYSPGWFEGRK